MPQHTPRSVLTVSQQGHLRARMMKSATTISTQIHQYLTTGVIKIQDKEIGMTSERLATYKLVLDRTIPTLHATEITRTSDLDNMTTDGLVDRLAQLAKARPELLQRLNEVLGGRLIEGTTIESSVPSPEEAGPTAAQAAAPPCARPSEPPLALLPNDRVATAAQTPQHDASPMS